MITEAIFTIFSKPGTWLLSLIPSTPSVVIPEEVYSSIETIVSNVGYILPIKGLLVIPATMVTLMLAKAIWALIIRVKSFIPTMGA